jgi:hypothetical protein
MNSIEDYLFHKLNLDISKDAQRYYQDARADAIHCYQSIEKYLDKDKKILEVGGGYSFAHQLFTPRLRYYFN